MAYRIGKLILSPSSEYFVGNQIIIGDPALVATAGSRITMDDDVWWFIDTDGKLAKRPPVFVAIAYSSSNAAYSPDGINWTAATMPSSAYWYGVAYGDGKFVAVAYNSSKAAYSPDGINWIETTLPNSGRWYSVIAKA
jgi:hypothetical protein